MSKVRSSIKNYLLGFLALGGAVLLRWLLDPLLGNTLPLVTIFGAVAAGVWLCGYRLAIVTLTVLDRSVVEARPW